MPWRILIFVAHGVINGSATDSRWHGCRRGTAFKAQGMTNAVYQIGYFMPMRNPTTWHWRHLRHHTDIVIVGPNTKITELHPQVWLRQLRNEKFFMVRKLPESAKPYLPDLHEAAVAAE